MTTLAQQFDTLLFDLDGVIYVGPHAVAHADAVLARLVGDGIRCAFVTNNAFRTPENVAEHLTELGFTCLADDVITSPQAAVPLLANYIAPGSRVLVIGGEGIAQALSVAGYVPVTSLEQQPEAVVQGYSPDISWRDLAEASYAVAAGLPWIATNPDLTFPTPRGIAPGNGSLVEVVVTATGRRPDAVAGKPEPPLLHEAVTRTAAQAPLMVGDRLDTDIAAGARVGMPTLLVLTGVTTVRDLLSAEGDHRPDYVGRDLRVLLAPYPKVERDALGFQCGSARAHVERGVLRVEGSDPADALRAAMAAAWQAPGCDLEPALSVLSALAGTVSSGHQEEPHAQ